VRILAFRGPKLEVRSSTKWGAPNKIIFSSYMKIRLKFSPIQLLMSFTQANKSDEDLEPDFIDMYNWVSSA